MSTQATLNKAIFDNQQQHWTARLDQVEAEHPHEFEAWKTAPAARTRAKAKARLDELEAEIEQIEANSANAADTFDAARDQITRLRTDWLAAGHAQQTDTSARKKAAVVRKVGR